MIHRCGGNAVHHGKFSVPLEVRVKNGFINPCFHRTIGKNLIKTQVSLIDEFASQMFRYMQAHLFHSCLPFSSLSALTALSFMGNNFDHGFLRQEFKVFTLFFLCPNKYFGMVPRISP